MKKELQKIINELKVQRSNAMHANNSYEEDENYSIAQYYLGMQEAFEYVIPMLTLLLNSESENSGKNDADNSDKPM